MLFIFQPQMRLEVGPAFEPKWSDAEGHKSNHLGTATATSTGLPETSVWFRGSQGPRYNSQSPAAGSPSTLLLLGAEPRALSTGVLPEMLSQVTSNPPQPTIASLHLALSPAAPHRS